MNPDKNITMFSTQIIQIVFEHQISMSEWFLKDHVTLKTGVLTAENSALPSQESITFEFILNFLKK